MYTTNPTTISLFGSGKIGEAICALLSSSNRYTVRVCDKDLSRAQAIASSWPNCTAHELKLSDSTATLALLKDSKAVISALPYFCNLDVAKLAKQAGVHYFDLTEDIVTSQAVSELAKNAPNCFMPQCGLAPGFISIAAGYLANKFKNIDSVKMRVGALPIYPSNRLKYNLTWSTEGLINEYANQCEVIRDGKKVQVNPLEGLERFSLDGSEYEAFYTSGGLGTFCESFAGKARTINYKSIRYPGHREQIALLMEDLKFSTDQATLCQIFERSIPHTSQDKVIILVEVSGMVERRLEQLTYASTIYNQTFNQKHFGAIQITTASGICTPVDLVLSGKLGKNGGFIKAEEISLLDFLDNEFGKYYKDEKALAGIN